MTTFRDLWVMLVEDDLYSQRMTQMMLRQFGVEKLVVVSDGARARDQFDETRGGFDLIVSDWNMPDVTGLDLLRHVRGQRGKTRFLMLTSNASRDFVLQARTHEVDAYIAKPFSASQLRQKIEMLFGIRDF